MQMNANIAVMTLRVLFSGSGLYVNLPTAWFLKFHNDLFEWYIGNYLVRHELFKFECYIKFTIRTV